MYITSCRIWWTDMLSISTLFDILLIYDVSMMYNWLLNNRFVNIMGRKWLINKFEFRYDIREQNKGEITLIIYMTIAIIFYVFVKNYRKIKKQNFSLSRLAKCQIIWLLILSKIEYCIHDKIFKHRTKI